MKNGKLSGPAIFMYSTIAVTAVLSTVMFILYYGGFTDSGAVLWSGIVSFMILYHFGLRIFMGNVSDISYNFGCGNDFRCTVHRCTAF